MKSSSSLPQEAATDSSIGDQAHDIGKLLWPKSVSGFSPVFRSQILSFLSLEDDSSLQPSLEKATPVTRSSCPFKILKKDEEKSMLNILESVAQTSCMLRTL